jgi:hypothetical protein
VRADFTLDHLRFRFNNEQSMIPSDLRLTRLADAASLLLFGGDDDRRSEATVMSLDRLFREITGLRETTVDLRDRSAISVPAGSAISPLDAGRCLLDPRRTAVYLRGVYHAIQEARRRFPAEVIHVLYAGCGPFAPLCLPLLPLLAGQAVHFTLLDVHTRAIESVQTIMAALRLEGANIECVVGDATRYRTPDRRPLHIVVSEAMQRALEKEPQVAILMNTAPQLAARGLMVPEMIAVDAVLTDLSRELGSNDVAAGPSAHALKPWKGRIPLGRILTANGPARGLRREHRRICRRHESPCRQWSRRNTHWCSPPPFVRSARTCCGSTSRVSLIR